MRTTFSRCRRILTLKALYNHDHTIFNRMQFPAGVDRDLFVDTLLYNFGEFPLVYSDSDYLRHMFGVWAKRNAYMINGLYKTTLFEYNPIWNKDSTITETRHVANEENGTRTPNLTTVTESEGGYSDASESHSTNSASTDSSGQQLNKVAPANVGSSLETATGVDSTATDESTGETDATAVTRRTLEGLKDTAHSTGTETSAINRTGEESVERREGGNIGVTTTQAMIAKERQIVQFDFYAEISRLFASEFCVMVYTNFWNHDEWGEY